MIGSSSLTFQEKYIVAARVCGILCGGVTINGEEYHFIGCSSSGLKERTCYMFKGSPNDISQVLEECGSFSSIKSRYKRLKQIGLLFSSATPTHIEIPDDWLSKYQTSKHLVITSQMAVEQLARPLLSDYVIAVG